MMKQATNSINTAAVIGCNWGLVHLHALSLSKVKIKAIVDLDLTKAQAIAKQHGIEHACDKIELVPEVDLVIIATPAFSHLKVIQHFQNSAIICEKPLLGVDILQHSNVLKTSNWPKKLWVNYAFSQLATAKLLEQLLLKTKGPIQAKLTTQVNLPLNFTVEQWFLETASHPLSWLLHLLGQPEQLSKKLNEQGLQLSLQCGLNYIELDFKLGGAAGIYHQLEFQVDSNVISVTGEYVPGQQWRFSPVMLNNTAQNNGEFSEGDCWIEANQRASILAIKQFRGLLSHEDFIKQGGFDATKALWVEQALFPHAKTTKGTA